MLLKVGSKGVQVTYLQYGLHIMCCSTGDVDGTFGAGTEAAVKKYQTRYGLTSDGQVGDATWNSLSAEIKIIQRALSQKGYYSSYVDGIAAEGTYNAVISFQRANGLSADGQVGDATRAKLMASGSIGGGSSDFPLKQGSVGDNVMYLQYGLHIMCCSPSGIDGTFGEGTYNAVIKFQNKYGLGADGIVGTGTWSKLQTQIKAIQNALISKGYNTNGADGIAGPATYEALITFQRKNGLSVDGQAGPATREKLTGSAGDGGRDTFPLKQGSQGPYVLFVQNALWIMCINPNGRDGAFGAGTASAVKMFQGNYGLAADGIVGTATWEKIRGVIRPIQQALVNHGYNTGGVDGIAGESTYNAVVAFQRANGLAADGMVGASTKQKLGISSSGGGSGTISATLSMGSNGSLTRYLQRMLQVLGYSLGTIDGIFGEDTKKAVIAFQNKYGLGADGVVGGGTWSKLFSVYRVPASGTGVEKMVNVAKHEFTWGFVEDNANNITPYGQWYGMNGAAWCAMFVSWCAYQAGIIGLKVPKYAYCPYGVMDYRARGKYYSSGGGYTPRIGDTIFFWNISEGVVGHTGIVVGVTATEVETIEGNSRDGVRKNKYNRSNTYIHGYGCNDGPAEPESPLTEQQRIASSKKQVNKILNSLNMPDMSASAKFPKDVPLFDNGWFKVTLKCEIENKVNFMKDCNVQLDLTNHDILYKGGSVSDSFDIIKSFVNPEEFMKIAFTTNGGKLGYKFYADKELINYEFVYVFEHEYDDTKSWTIQMAIVYSFSRKNLPTALSVSIDYVNELVESVKISIEKKQILYIMIVIMAILLFAPLMAGGMTLGVVVTTVIKFFDAIKEIVAKAF